MTSPPTPREVPSRVLAGGSAGRELAAWEAAVRHLHAVGLPAAVPQFAYHWLRRRGVRADWRARGEGSGRR